jgi:hypothetical protein
MFAWDTIYAFVTATVLVILLSLSLYYTTMKPGDVSYNLLASGLAFSAALLLVMGIQGIIVLIRKVMQSVQVSPSAQERLTYYRHPVYQPTFEMSEPTGFEEPEVTTYESPLQSPSPKRKRKFIL